MITRRHFIAACSGMVASATFNVRADDSNAEQSGFDFGVVIERAKQLAAAPYQNPHGKIPKPWLDINYDQHRAIRFKPERALWRGERLFELQFFHPGLYFDYPVAIHIVNDDKATPLAYDPDLFTFDKLDPQQLGTDGLGFAGFRVHYPLNRSAYADEFAVFLGASYFRLLGRDQHYGLSARGLAIDTAESSGEEFPLFEAFWIEQPQPQDTSLIVYALMNSPSLSGAYRFVLRPRTDTQVEVQSVLFTRNAVSKLGVAPLTSMFLYGEDGTRQFDDFRPEVHDSDGLQIHSGSGEWIWRPLVNRQQLNISSFFIENPRGFGLIQRDRVFSHYEDLESEYHRRPSLWVQPLGDWGKGRVELVEIPSDEEINDNIVSYWVPEQPIEAGQELKFNYLLNAFLENNSWPPGGRVQSTRIGSAVRPGMVSDKPKDARLFVIDFNGGDLPHLADDQPLEAVVNVSRGSVSQPVAQKNRATGGWRVFFDFFPDGNESAELRCYLRLYNSGLSETWNYLWTA